MESQSNQPKKQLNKQHIFLFSLLKKNTIDSSMNNAEINQ